MIYAKITENVGKSQEIILKWVIHNRKVGLIYVVHVEKLLRKRIFEKLRAELNEMQAGLLPKRDDDEMVNVVFVIHR